MSKPSIEEFRSSNVDSVKVIQVVEVKSIFGDGEPAPYSPIRQITEYFSLEGELLAVKDIYRDRTPHANTN